MEFTRNDPGGDPADELIGQLAADLSVITGRALRPGDFRARRDGALAQVLGAMVTVDPRRRQTACRLLAEWIRAGSLESAGPPQTAGPMEFEIPTLVVGERVVPGLRLVPPPPGGRPVETLERLLPAAAALAGAMPEVVQVGPGSTERSPGWVARLRLLARLDEIGGPGADRGEWAVAAHEAVASVHVPDAEPGSVWAALVDAVRTHAQAALQELGEEVKGDLLRRDDEFGEIVDMRLSAILDGGPVPGRVLQIVRLPRRRGGRTLRGAVLFAGGGAA
ncbi:hypothetical protein Misp01_43200 [Microtetraspora sp. NBRC 13810]|uniref:hypothetical protein n=1 Tax=Microtetraspora sp. NBRC 13810 TaxID=3030990 RepID=UPI0024A392B4|nr:hypothetical protein [Microtetraspora sp. NBRC 13810]GLW09191.1 hypothetical protein Misp01_43200 [Microtetraspora sp. NBRC 13810]